jgi:hypothetical protein
MKQLSLFFITWFLGIMVLARFVWPFISNMTETSNIGGWFVVIIGTAWTLSCMAVSMK